MSETDEVLVGVVGRPHGIGGEVSVRPTTDFTEQRFAAGSRLRGRDRVLTVVMHRWHREQLLVTFEGLADRAGAELLRGSELWAAATLVELDGDDEFLDRQLIGLEVRQGSRVVGRVELIRHLPAQDLLIVATPSGQRPVPFVTALVPRIELGEGWLEVVDMPGLLEDVAEEVSDAD